MSATSAWGRIVGDTIDRVKAIVPTISPDLRWHYVPESRSSDEPQFAGASWRQFETEIAPGSQLAFHGGGLRKAKWTLVLKAAYLPSEDILDVVGADHRDLMEALQPTSTYGSGAWGALCVRRVGEPDEPVRDEGVVDVRYPIEITFRQPVTMT